MNKKGQGVGLVTGLVFGVAGLVIGVIIAFLLISTLTGAGLLTENRQTTAVTNETGWLNATTYTLDEVETTRLSYALTAMWANESTEYNVSIPLANATVSAIGVVTRAGAEAYNDVYFSYTYLTKTSEELASDRLSTNFTAGIDNVSGKLPTVLLVAAIVLILGVLAILVGVWQRMRMGSGQL